MWTLVLVALAAAARAADIVVTSPNSATIWERSSTVTVEWATTSPATGTDPSVVVQLFLYVGDVLIDVVTDFGPTDNDGQFSFFLSGTADLTSDARVQARLIRGLDTLAEDMSPAFEITVARELSVESISNVFGGSVVPVRWSTEGAVSSVDVFLRKRGLASTQQTINLGYPDTGVISWSVPNVEGDDYYIRVRDSASDAYGDSNYFDIREGILFTFSAPLTDTIVYRASTYQVTWSLESGSVTSSLSLVLVNGDAEVVSTIATLSSSTRTYSWTVSASQSLGVVQLALTDSLRDFMSLGPVVTVTEPPPTIVVEEPTADTVWLIGDSVRINWEVVGDDDGLEYVTIEVMRNAAVVDTVTSTIQHWQDSMSYRVPSLTVGTYTVRIRSNTGGAVTGVSPPFEVATPPPPAITVESPASGDFLVRDEYTTIVWSWVGILTEVRVDLFKGSSLVYTIDDDVLITSTRTSPKSLVHPLDENLVEGSDYRVRVQSTTDTGVFDFSSYFTIQELASLVFQPFGQILYTNNRYDLAWEVFGTVYYFYLDVFKGATMISEGRSRIDDETTTFQPQSHWLTEPGSNSQFRTRVRSTTDALVSTFSHYFEIREGQYIFSNVPTWSLTFQAGETVDCEWNQSGNILAVNIKLQLYDENTFQYSDVATVETEWSAATRAYTYQIPLTLAPGRYQLRFTSATDPDEANGESRGTGATNSFLVVAADPDIDVLAPEGGSEVQQGETLVINWQGISLQGPVTITLFSASNSVGVIASGVSLSISELEWTMPALTPGGGYYVVVEDPASGVSGTSGTFTITAAPRSVTAVTEPSAGEIWLKGSTHPIEWTTSGPLTTVGLRLLQDGIMVLSIDDGAPNTGSYDFAVPGPGVAPEEGVYAVRVVDPENPTTVYATSALFAIFDPTQSDLPFTQSRSASPDPDTVPPPASFSIVGADETTFLGRFMQSSTFEVEVQLAGLESPTLEYQPRNWDGDSHPVSSFSGDSGPVRLSFGDLRAQAWYNVVGAGLSQRTGEPFEAVLGHVQTLEDWVTMTISTSISVEDYDSETTPYAFLDTVGDVLMANMSIIYPPDYVRLSNVRAVDGKVTFELLVGNPDPVYTSASVASVILADLPDAMATLETISSDRFATSDVADPVDALHDEFDIDVVPEGDDDDDDDDDNDGDGGSGGLDTMILGGIVGGAVAVIAFVGFIRTAYKRSQRSNEFHQELREV